MVYHSIDIIIIIIRYDLKNAVVMKKLEFHINVHTNNSLFSCGMDNMMKMFNS